MSLKSLHIFQLQLVFLETPSNNKASQQFRRYKRSLSSHLSNSYLNNQNYGKSNRLGNQRFFESSKQQKQTKQHAPKQWKTAYSLTKSQCSYLIKNQSALSFFVQQSTTRFDVLTSEYEYINEFITLQFRSIKNYAGVC